MFTTILIVALLILALAWTLVAPRLVLERGTRFEHSLSRVWGLIPLALAVLALLFSTLGYVQAKNAGVVTSFGKPVDTKSSGLYIKAPWHKVTELDGTIQTDRYGNGSDECNDDNRGISVKIGDGSRACVSLTNRWQIVDDKAGTIYADYRSDDPTASLRQAVVTTQLHFAVQEAMADFNPVASLQAVDADQAASEIDFNPDFEQLGLDIRKALEARPGSDLIQIEDITVSYVGFSKSTQATINEFIAEVGRTRVASQAKATAAEQAAANRELAESVSDDPGVAQLRCLETVGKAIDAGYQLPAGFNCVGAGTSVVVPSGK